MKRTIELEYWVRDRVSIPELKLQGRVNAIFIGDDGEIQYRVRHFKDGESKSDYFLLDEIAPTPDTKPTFGFTPETSPIAP